MTMTKQLRSLVLPIVFGLVALPAAVAANHDAGSDLSDMQRQVRHELVMLPFLSVFDNLTYQVNGATVVLEGQVYRPSVKLSAERVVARVEGVELVENNIEVLPTSFHDDRIRALMVRAIYSHPVLDRNAAGAVPSIRIVVRNGDVTLEGVVNREMEKTVATIQANSVPGVFSVTNNLQVEVPNKG